MEIFDTPQKDQMSKEQIEFLDKQKHEFKLIGRLRKMPGHTLKRLVREGILVKKSTNK